LWVHRERNLRNLVGNFIKPHESGQGKNRDEREGLKKRRIKCLALKERVGIVVSKNRTPIKTNKVWSITQKLRAIAMKKGKGPRVL